MGLKKYLTEETRRIYMAMEPEDMKVLNGDDSEDCVAEG